MKYFAYGSNCNPAIMRKKGVEFTSRQRALLRGYRLKFNKKSLREQLPDSIGFANINVDPEGVVEGVLYEVVDEHQTTLDESERYPDHYDRILVEVETDSEIDKCWVYRAQPDKTAEGLVPSRNYLNHLLTARDFLSRQYFDALDLSQTYTGECACCHVAGEVLFLKEFDQMYTLCQSCREARTVWGDVRGRKLSVPETEAVMSGLVAKGAGYASLQELIAEAVALKLIDP
ncbi:MAG: gamma-glutamylcyclotransferase family protein [Pirellulaceae bacterium]